MAYLLHCLLTETSVVRLPLLKNLFDVHQYLFHLYMVHTVQRFKDGKLAHMAPPSTIALSGNGLDTAALIEDDEDLTSGAGNGANPNPPQSV